MVGKKGGMKEKEKRDGMKTGVDGKIPWMRKLEREAIL